MPRLRSLVCGGLALAGVVQLLLFAVVLRKEPSAQPLRGSHTRTPFLPEPAAPLQTGGAVGGEGAFDTVGSKLLGFHGRGLSVFLRLGAENRSLWWESTSADLEGTGGEPPQDAACRGRKLGPELFSVHFHLRSGGGFASSACRMGGLSLSESSAAASFSCPGGTSVRWELRLQQDQHFARISVELSAEEGAAEDAAKPPGKLTLLEVPPAEGCDRVYPTGSVPGSPVLIGKRWFLGAEHPLGLHEPIGGAFHQRLGGGGSSGGVRAAVGHLGVRTWPPRPGAPWRYGAALGACGEGSQARRAFLAYLDAVRPPERWRRQMLHYNSWFDMHSWQDDEFFPEESIYPVLQREEMTESLAIDRVESFSEGLGRNHSLPMDSYLWDDGWDDPKTLWDFDRARFPRGFSKVAAAAKGRGSGIGVWLSPWGGYGSAQKQRLKLGLEQGYETNEGGFSLAGPRYFQRFREAVLSMRRDYNVNLFKFDGVAGDPREVAEEMEAMLALISEIRRAKHSQSNRTEPGRGARGGESSGKEKGGSSKEEDPWINLTTGTWPSPFFLLWADSIWRGGGDVGHLKFKKMGNLTVRQTWIVWRELMVCSKVVMRASFFPLAQLMIHGVVLGYHGEALLRGLHRHTELDFAQEAWSFVGMGLQLQELYLTPALLEPADWGHLAEALKWSRANLDVLRDSHWVLGDFRDWGPYGVASWRPATASLPALGFLMLRNPIARSQRTGPFTLDDLLELPSRELGLSLQVDVVRSLSDGPERSGCALGDAHNVSGLASSRCVAEASKTSTVFMRPAEVLILQLQLVKQG